ncbi:lamin tail domain-containing protein, partial [bacterium]|nr:lamin tail domain-containing protein [bacterium]
MFNPNSPNSEFVEIYNYGSASIDLTDWRLFDYQDVDTLKDFSQGLLLGPKKFAVIFESDYDTAAGIYKTFIPASALIVRVNDTQIGNALGNTGDNVILIRPIGDTLSKYTYSIANSTGISDEKINVADPLNTASNWADSKTTNGTPGNYPELDLSIKEHR